MLRTIILCLGFAPFLINPDFSHAQEINWKRIKLDDTFRAEGVAMADVNRDGKNDVLAGDVWYEAPNWEMREIRKPGKFVAGVGYSDCFVNFAYDINRDGWDDLIYIGFPGDPFFWYENPKNKPGHWKKNLIWHSVCNESPLFTDLTGDGIPELILGSQPESQMGYISIPTGSAIYEKWKFTPISRPGNPMKNGTFKYYHGLGVGDLNNDGRNDVLIAHGWWEAPQSPTSATWEFHPYSLSKEKDAAPLKASNIYTFDLDHDGDNDIITGSAHDFGVWWFENIGGNENPQFKYHLIDESYSQTHAIHLVDINNDGTKDIVTGKRFFAHNGRDPGGKDPVVMYWYEIHTQRDQPPKFIPHKIDAGDDTGVGTQFEVNDFNNDGRIDIILSNKKGVNVLLQ